MTYLTGTIAQLTDVLDVFATFLSSAGWTIQSNWLEPIQYGVSGSTSLWRYSRRMSASKGNKFVAMQDFYITRDVSFGTANIIPGIGPGIALIMGTAATPKASHALSFYNATGPVSPTFATDVSGIPGSTTGILRTVIMPLPAVTHLHNGTWDSSSGAMAIADPTGDTPFGVPGAGSGTPMKYWMFADATGDNVALVTQHDDGRSWIQKTPYLFFGDLIKAGNWAQTGTYFGASHGVNSVFDGLDGLGHSIFRFGPPASIMDNAAATFFVRVDVDSTAVGAWPCVCATTAHPGTGRRLLSNAVMRVLPTDPVPSVAGFQPINGFLYGSLRSRASSIQNAAPCLPIKVIVERDSGLFSVVGDLPNIYQAFTDGFSPGTATLNAGGSTVVVFDGFAVLKVP